MAILPLEEQLQQQLGKLDVSFYERSCERANAPDEMYKPELSPESEEALAIALSYFQQWGSEDPGKGHQPRYEPVTAFFRRASAPRHGFAIVYRTWVPRGLSHFIQTNPDYLVQAGFVDSETISILSTTTQVEITEVAIEREQEGRIVSPMPYAMALKQAKTHLPHLLHDQAFKEKIRQLALLDGRPCIDAQVASAVTAFLR